MTNNDPIAITGLGCVTAAGKGLACLQRALATGASLLRRHADPALPLSADFPTAPVTVALPQAPQRSTALALASTTEALRQAGLDAASRRRCGLVVGTCTGGMRESDAWYLQEGPDRIGACYRQQQTHRVAEHLARHEHLLGPQSSHSVACSSSGCALAEAGEWIRQGLCDRVLACGTDALCRVTMAGFHSLQVMDPDGCRPLSAGRTGMSLGEGAASLVLESATAASSRGARVLAWLVGWGQSADAHHATAPEPEGTALEQAITSALADAAVPTNAVDYINLHGTGTRDNDAVETTVVDRLFGQVPVASSKACTGHTMGAAAAIEAVVAALALQEQCQWASTGIDGQEAMPGVAVVRRSQDRPLDHVLSTSLAFGGNNVALLLRRAA